METVNQQEVKTTAEGKPAPETKWYVLRVVSGKERKVKEYLDKEISRGGWGEVVKQVFLPVEKVYKVQNGKKVMRERNYYPGYVMIEVTDGKLGDDLRESLIHLHERDPGVLDVLGQMVDLVEPVEQRPERPADRYVETVLLPIEVALDRAEEIVDIRDLLVYLVADPLQVLNGEHRLVQFVGHLLEEPDLFAQDCDGVRLDLGLRIGVGVLLPVERELLPVAAALRGE